MLVLIFFFILECEAMILTLILTDMLLPFIWKKKKSKENPWTVLL